MEREGMGIFFSKKQRIKWAEVSFKNEPVKNERSRRESSEENNNNSNAVDVDVQKCEQIRHATIQFRDCQSKK